MRLRLAIIKEFAMATESAFAAQAPLILPPIVALALVDIIAIPLAIIVCPSKCA